MLKELNGLTAVVTGGLRDTARNRECIETTRGASLITGRDEAAVKTQRNSSTSMV